MKYFLYYYIDYGCDNEHKIIFEEFDTFEEADRRIDQLDKESKAYIKDMRLIYGSLSGKYNDKT